MRKEEPKTNPNYARSVRISNIETRNLKTSNKMKLFHGRRCFKKRRQFVSFLLLSGSITQLKGSASLTNMALICQKTTSKLDSRSLIGLKSVLNLGLLFSQREGHIQPQMTSIEILPNIIF
jgi:hypothetical protein